MYRDSWCYLQRNHIRKASISLFFRPVINRQLPEESGVFIKFNMTSPFTGLSAHPVTNSFKIKHQFTLFWTLCPYIYIKWHCVWFTNVDLGVQPWGFSTSMSCTVLSNSISDSILRWPEYLKSNTQNVRFGWWNRFQL